MSPQVVQGQGRSIVLRRTIGRRAVQCVVWWAAFVAASTLQEFYTNHWRGSTQTIWPILLRHTIAWTIWVLFAPAVVKLAERLPVRGAGDIRRVSAHGIIAIGLSLLHSTLIAAMYPLFYYAPSAAAFRDVLRDRVMVESALNVVVYAAIIALVQGVAHARAAESRATDVARLEARAARAELRLLYEQLQPHFVFNTLTSAIELVNRDAARAETLLRDLSALLRRSLESVRAPLTTVRDELAFTERYAAIQRLRFPTLHVDISADPTALELEVPRLLLQPLVENSIKNSVGRHGEGHVTVRAGVGTAGLRLSVADDGRGFQRENEVEHHAGHGVGLANVRARLEVLYAANYAMSLSENDGGGATVVIDLPARSGI